jgi:hypothetical protein
MLFDNFKGHTMVQFVQKEANHQTILGFGGAVNDDGTLTVIRGYFKEGTPTDVDYGMCKFFYKNGHRSTIFCTMVVDEAGRRTAALVSFDIAPGQTN